MFVHYLTTAWRQILKNRLYSFINITGLGAGLAATILIMLYVKDELSYDQFLAGTEDVYRLETRFTPPGQEPSQGPLTQIVTFDFLLNDFPEIKAAAQLTPFGQVTLQYEDRQFAESTMLASPHLLDVLPFVMIEGDGHITLQTPDAVILSEEVATKIFGRETAMGKTISLQFNNEMRDYSVAAIMQDIPDTSHLSFDVLVPYDEDHFAENPFGPQAPVNWVMFRTLTYLRLQQNTNLDAFQAAMPGFLDRHTPDDIAATLGGIPSARFQFNPVQLQDIHLYGAPDGRGVNDPAILGALAIIAAFILIIGCANFINLSTARNLGRAHEVAVRKTVGAQRWQLIIQFLGESSLTVILAAFIAAVLVEATLPFYRDFLTYTVGANYAGDPAVLLGFIALIVVVGLGAGGYPAIVLSSFSPVGAFKAAHPGGPGSIRLRSVLVVIQFSISIALVTSTSVLVTQIRHALNKEMGFDSDNVVVVRGLGGNNLPQRETFMNRLRAVADVDMVANSTIVPGDGYPISTRITLSGEEVQRMIGYVPIGFNFFETYGVTTVAGRLFSNQFATDPAVGYGDSSQRAVANTVINETAARSFGFDDPTGALGQTFTAGINFRTDFTVIGVIPDIYFASTRQEIRPEIFILSVNGGAISIRHRGNDLPALLETIDTIWNELMPDQTISREFLDDNVAEQYNQDQRIATLLAAFAGLAMIISSLGLYGLAAYSTQQRTKEIGIRKVMGAKITNILHLIIWQFLKPVLLANLIAWPIAWYASRGWLDGFHDRIGLSPMFFVGASIFTLLVAWLTVAGHAIGIARTSPIAALRHE